MTFKFISALYGAAASLAILTAGGVEAASYSAPVAQQQQVLIAQSNISQTTYGEGGWIEGGETDEYSYASFSFEFDGVVINSIGYSDGLSGSLILYRTTLVCMLLLKLVSVIVSPGTVIPTET